MILTYRYRIKDGGTATRRALRAQARAVNYVWNYCCEIDREAHRRWKAGRPVRRPTSYDLANLCRGVTGELGIHSDTVDAVCARFADARKACFPRTPRFRSFKRSLDWVPFSNFKRPAKLAEGVLTLMRRRYRLWQSRPLPEGGRPTSWCLSVDARGRWYANIQVEVPEGDLRDGLGARSRPGFEGPRGRLRRLARAGAAALPRRGAPHRAPSEAGPARPGEGAPGQGPQPPQAFPPHGVHGHRATLCADLRRGRERVPSRPVRASRFREVRPRRELGRVPRHAPIRVDRDGSALCHRVRAVQFPGVLVLPDDPGQQSER